MFSLVLRVGVAVDFQIATNLLMDRLNDQLVTEAHLRDLHPCDLTVQKAREKVEVIVGL